MDSSAWFVAFRPSRSYKAPTRWLSISGAITNDKRRAVTVTSPEAAAERLQVFVQARGLPTRAVERFQLVAAA
jgi:hypothetical protein